MQLCVVLMGSTSTERKQFLIKQLFVFEEEEEITSCKVWRKKIWFQSESLWECCHKGLCILCINCSLILQLTSVVKECECCSSFSLGVFTSIYWYEDVPITLRLPAIPQIGYSGEHSALQKVRYEHLFTGWISQTVVTYSDFWQPTVVYSIFVAVGMRRGKCKVTSSIYKSIKLSSNKHWTLNPNNFHVSWDPVWRT